jgi:hypothetical protein
MLVFLAFYVTLMLRDISILIIIEIHLILLMTFLWKECTKYLKVWFNLYYYTYENIYSNNIIYYKLLKCMH